MEIILILKLIIEYTLFLYFGFAALYILVFTIAGRFLATNKKIKHNSVKFRKFAVLIPGYKEDNVIIEVATQALAQNYPKNLFEVIIIADSFLPETIESLRKLPITLIEVSFEKSTKSKALNKAMEVIGDEFDVALVLDADNIMEQNFISKINSAFENNFKIVQGHRIAKNLNNSMAILDAISEEINNHIFRKGHRAIGLSSALIGSGMAFEYSLFKERMKSINAVGGFDKELELTLLRDNFKIEYLDDAKVMDEKVQKIEVFENQRKRWLSAQFVYFKKFFLSGVSHFIKKGNIDFIDKVYQMITPPRILLFGITFILAIFSLLIHYLFPQIIIFSIPFQYWLTIFLFVLISFVLSLPRSFYNKNTLLAILSTPKVFKSMLKSLLKLKGANKKFIHTEHGKIT